MPVIEFFDKGDYSVGIWEMTETLQELSSLYPLDETGLTEIERFRGEKRRREYLTVRLLLMQMTGEKKGIAYEKSGKPYLPSSEMHISISHSQTLTVIILSFAPAGIDTEEINRDVEQIAPRFLSANEVKWTKEAQNPCLARLFCWSCKESVYKMRGITGIQFRENILLESLNINMAGMAKATFMTGKWGEEKIDISYLMIRSSIITWCIAENKNPVNSPLWHKTP